MSLFDKPTTQITERDLQALISDKEAEHKTVDYKRDAVGSSDSDKKEFLYDASSFANTVGGHIIFGMEEAQGLPVNLVGLAGVDQDGERLRLEQMIRTGIRPPLTGVETTGIRLSNGNVALVMRVSKSWNPAHQVTFQNAFRFYARGSNGKYQIDVDELRSIFAISGTIAERIRDYRADRVAKIVIGNAPVTLLDGGALALHVVPFSAFSTGGAFSLDRAARDPDEFPPIGRLRAQQFQITFDGLLTTSNAEAPPRPQRAYTLVSRTGTVEAGVSSLARGRSSDFLILPAVEDMIVRFSGLYMHNLHALGVEPPFAVLASLINVKGMRLLTGDVPQGALPEEMPGGASQRNNIILLNRFSILFRLTTKRLLDSCGALSITSQTRQVFRRRRLSTLAEIICERSARNEYWRRKVEKLLPSCAGRECESRAAGI